mmetsp:Transcript_27586/g.39158  ORF Transcript_27586/g.39158 Transcript_27586/m.39158 type:complete len:93 (+) Transcript_27586:301-579(+)
MSIVFPFTMYLIFMNSSISSSYSIIIFFYNLSHFSLFEFFMTRMQDTLTHTTNSTFPPTTMNFLGTEIYRISMNIDTIVLLDPCNSIENSTL